MKLSPYCKIYPSEDTGSCILFLTMNAAKIRVPSSIISEIENHSLPEDEQAELCKLGFLIDNAEREKAATLAHMVELNAINRSFYAKVVMNLDCNLACKYCFEGTRKGKLYMSQETADSLVEFIDKSLPPDKKEINITFYGGEPMLSSGLIQHISERLNTVAESKGLKYGFILMTNGTLLTPRTVDKLRTLGLRGVSVTLDGPAEVHNRYRPFISGKGSFDAIFRNLHDICGMTNIQIGGNYTQDNYLDFPRLLDYLMENELMPDRISDVQFDPVTRESNEFALPDFREGCSSGNEPWLTGASIYLREEILKRGYRTRRVMPITCMMELKDNFVINFNGDIYKCAGLIGREQFRIGNLKSGIKDYALSHQLNNWKNDDCLNCCYLPLCFGGCRYMKLLQTGSMEGIDCKKPYFDAVLETLVHQDIKYARQLKS